MKARQTLFCQAYVLCLDAQKAARDAGYSPKRAKQTGYDLLQLDEIQTEIAHLRAIRDANFGMKAADVLREIADIAMTDIGDVLTWGMEEVEGENEGLATLPDGKALMRPVIKPVRSLSLTDSQRRAIKSISVSKKGVFKIELHDRLKALELLGRHYGLFEKDNKRKDQAGANTVAALVEACQGPPLMPNAMNEDN